MCLKSFKHALNDCFGIAMDLFVKDRQLDVTYGTIPEHAYIEPVLTDIINTHQTLPTKTYRKEATEDCKVITEDPEVLELVHKLETYKKPVIVLILE